MLVLSRKATEKLQIGNDITITILRVKGQAVRVGIDAPKNVRVLRSEVSADEPVVALSDEPAESFPVRAPLAARVAALQAG